MIIKDEWIICLLFSTKLLSSKWSASRAVVDALVCWVTVVIYLSAELRAFFVLRRAVITRLSQLDVRSRWINWSIFAALKNWLVLRFIVTEMPRAAHGQTTYNECTEEQRTVWRRFSSAWKWDDNRLIISMDRYGVGCLISKLAQPILCRNSENQEMGHRETKNWVC